MTVGMVKTDLTQIRGKRSRLRRPQEVFVCLAGASALAGCFSCGGGGKSSIQDAGKQGFSRCIEDWPSANGPHPTKPSLNVEAPKVVSVSGWSGKTNSDCSRPAPQAPLSPRGALQFWRS
jgi:hypothetical protein